MSLMDELRTGRSVRVLQIVVGAMCIGAIAFLLTAWLVPMEPKGGQPILSYLAPAFGLVAAPLGFALPAILMGPARRRIAGGELAANIPTGGPNPSEKDQLYGMLATVTIIGSAMLEGALLLAIVAFMIERQSIALGTALVLLALLLTRIPTRTGVDAWIAKQSQLIEQIRSTQRDRS